MSRTSRLFGLFCILCLAWLVGTPQVFAGEQGSSPELVLEKYLRAMYARDSAVAYTMLSSDDTAVKSRDEYLTENGHLAGAQLELSKALANAIQFDSIEIDTNVDRATAIVSVALPNANDPILFSTLDGFDKARLQALDQEALKVRQSKIEALRLSGELPYIQSNGEQWELVRENGEWRVFENWADAIEVHFDAMVIGALGWEFEPLQSRVLAQPGQTIQMAYRAHNLGSVETTGKARHVIGPDTSTANYMEIVSCFCFFDQVLAPGESIDMSLVFRVDFNVPEDVEEFTVQYIIYPFDEFPEEHSS